MIPEFPGQTHIFFWREIGALRRMGVDAEVASTRRPQSCAAMHTWAGQAAAEAFYLHPARGRDLVRAGMRLLAAGPLAWADCLGAAMRAERATWKDRLRYAAMIAPAAVLAARARERGWRHLHCHSCANAAMITRFASRLSGIPYSLTLHCPLRLMGPAQREKWSGAAFGLVVSDHLKREVLDKIAGLTPERVGVAPMGVDVARFTRRGPYEPARGGEPWRLVSCGRLNNGKGHQYVIRAMRLLLDRGRSATLRILGEGPFRPELEALIRELGLGDAVTLTGSLSEEAVRGELERAHLHVLCSPDEAIGVATMEAMAMRLPVIACRVCGVPELVREGVDGLLVEPHEVEPIADAIQTIMTAPEKALAMGSSGRDHVERRYGTDVSAEALARFAGLGGGASGQGSADRGAQALEAVA